MEKRRQVRGREPNRRYSTSPPSRQVGEKPHTSVHSQPTYEEKDALIDLYDDAYKPKPGEPDPEVEELKQLAQSDVLKFYAWVRRHSTRISTKVSNFKQKFTSRHLKYTSMTLSAVLMIVLGIQFLPGLVDRFSSQNDVLGTQTQADFPTLNPQSEPSSQGFDEETGVAVFKEDLSGVQITVSQQKLPEELRNNPDELQKLAISLDEKTAINRHETQKGLIYIAQTEGGGNITIFNYQDLLIFIRSNAVLDDQIWIDYVNSLEL